jgi:5-methylcytosine-specific restriction enzyme A
MTTTWKHFAPASTPEYVRALKRIMPALSDKHKALLTLQILAPEKTVTASQLAESLGYSRHSPINNLYGSMGRKLAAELGRSPEPDRHSRHNWWAVLSTGRSDDDGFKWTMHPELAAALEAWHWPPSGNITLPEEIPADAHLFFEGAVRSVRVNAYKRNQRARIICIAHYGACCHICKLDLTTLYGDVAKGFIHVHHERPLSSIGERYLLNPIEDLKPVCPNCHAIIHLRTPPFSIEEVQELLSSSCMDKPQKAS